MLKVFNNYTTSTEYSRKITDLCFFYWPIGNVIIFLIKIYIIPRNIRSHYLSEVSKSNVTLLFVTPSYSEYILRNFQLQVRKILYHAVLQSMAKSADDGLLQANDGKLLVDDGVMLAMMVTLVLTIIDEHFTIITIICSFDHP